MTEQTESECEHVWVHDFGTHGPHGHGSTWCVRCSRTAFDIERERDRRAVGEAAGK